MTVTPTTIPCTGLLRDEVTSDNKRFGLLVNTADHRHTDRAPVSGKNHLHSS